MSISNRKESNSNSNQMTNSTQLKELSFSDSNNNNEGNYLFLLKWVLYFLLINWPANC